jgi:hypothetical protein
MNVRMEVVGAGASEAAIIYIERRSGGFVWRASHSSVECVSR